MFVFHVVRRDESFVIEFALLLLVVATHSCNFVDVLLVFFNLSLAFVDCSVVVRLLIGVGDVHHHCLFSLALWSWIVLFWFVVDDRWIGV